jgi:hypothetical protein
MMKKIKTIFNSLLVFSLLFFTASIDAESFLSKHLARAQFTTYVSNHEPVNNVKKLDTSYNSVYFFVDVRDCKGCKIIHEWWHAGTRVGSIKGKASSVRYRWWSKKTLTPNMTGEWTVKVFIDGRKVLTRTVRYEKASLQQEESKDIQERIQTQESSECELQLRYFSDKVEQNPKDAYFKFMLDKWGKRCLPE